MQQAAVLGKTFTLDGLAAVSGLGHEPICRDARRRWPARSSSPSRPIRAPRSAASTASCRTWCARSPATPSAGASASACTWPPPITSPCSAATSWPRSSPPTGSTRTACCRTIPMPPSCATPPAPTSCAPPTGPRRSPPPRRPSGSSPRPSISSPTVPGRRPCTSGPACWRSRRARSQTPRSSSRGRSRSTSAPATRPAGGPGARPPRRRALPAGPRRGGGAPRWRTPTPCSPTGPATPTWPTWPPSSAGWPG